MEFRIVHLKNFLIIPILIVFIFLIPTIISFTDKNFLKNHINDKLVTTDLLLNFFSYENASLRTGIYKDNEPFLIKSINLMNEMTNINMNNLWSFIQNELPGYYTTKEGQKLDMNFTMESAPPLTELKKERELAINALEQKNGDTTESKQINGIANKKIFIYHTHSWESYSSLENPQVATLNIRDVGEWLGEVLNEKGIAAVVDKTNISQELEKQGWQTNKSYQISRNLVQTVMASSSDFEYFIDLHRDSARKDQTTITVNNKPYARIVFVIGEENKHYEQNLKLAKKLDQFLEDNYPGVSKGILGKYGDGVDGVYNQDLSPNSLVIEVGGVDNNETEIKNTVDILADALGQEYWQATEVNGMNENDYSTEKK